jgi:hypothetical protein
VDEDIDIADLIEAGWSEEEINEALLDAGYDAEDMAEAWVDAGYDYQDALYDAIEDQLVDVNDADMMREYADILDMDISEVYDLYYGYPEDD